MVHLFRDPRAYDTALSGGALNYGTATGLNAEDIVVDGDGFVTPAIQVVGPRRISTRTSIRYT